MQLETNGPLTIPIPCCPLCGGSDRSFLLGSGSDPIAVARCTTCALVHASGRYEPDFLNDDVYGYTGPAVSLIQAGRKAKALERYDRILEGRLLEGASGARVLDIGCNTGALLDQFRKHGFRTEGIERSEGAARTARRHHQVYEVDVTAPGLALGRLYDVITLSHVLEHIERPAAALRFVDRHLAPGGVAIIEVPNWNDITRRFWGRRYRPLELGDHVAFYDSSTLSRAIDASGLRTLYQWSGPQAAALVMPNLLTAADLGYALLQRGLARTPSVATPRTHAHAAPSLLRRLVLSTLDRLDPLLDRTLGKEATWGPNLICIAGKVGVMSH